MPLKTHLDEQPTLNLTPMIDIVFLLIIFFMVGTKFSELERKIGLRVPEVSNVEALTPAPEPRVVNVYADGQIMLDRTPVANLNELTQQLVARTQSSTVIWECSCVVMRRESSNELPRCSAHAAKPTCANSASPFAPRQ